MNLSIIFYILKYNVLRQYVLFTPSRQKSQKTKTKIKEKLFNVYRLSSEYENDSLNKIVKLFSFYLLFVEKQNIAVLSA